MKLRYKVSVSTKLQPHIITDKIISALVNDKYTINKITNNSVQFDEDPWQLIRNLKNIRRFSGGIFKLEVSESDVLVSFNYYIDLLPLVLILSFVVFVLFFSGQLMSFFILLFPIVCLIEFVILKSVAKAMLAVILD